MNIAIISDLHLNENDSKIADIFLRFLEKSPNNFKALYILGDFFEVWIGDDNLSPFNLRIIRALQSATRQGLQIYFMHGNRDFLIGKKFIKMTGCQLLPDEQVINLFNVPTLLMHGDSLCTADIRYMKFRKRTRKWIVKKLFLMKPLEKRKKMVAQYREASQLHQATLSDHIMDVTPSEVEKIMIKHGVQHLIHGHTHRKAIHHFTLNQNPATRTVLDAWHQQGNALICTMNGNDFIHLD